MKLIDRIDFPEFIDEISSETKNIYLSLPSIDAEIAEILFRKANDISIKVLIDNSEELIRNGFGEEAGIDKIIHSNIQIFQAEGNLVSFLIFDNVGYFIFPQSKIFLSKATGANAFRIDPFTIKLLIQYYFHGEKQNEENMFEHLEAGENSIKHFESVLKVLNTNEANVVFFDKEKYRNIKENLKINPPLSPDLQRHINIYTAKIQFVELKFSGGNLENRIAKLPQRAIPINSDELKNLLLTRIKMFQDLSDNSEYSKFQDFKGKVEDIRKQFLTPITCRPGKSIIKMEKKKKFMEELNTLKEEAETLHTALSTMLEEGKLNTKDLLRKELKTFFRVNEPEELKIINNEEVKERKMKDIIDTIVSSVKFPEVSKLIKNISLGGHFYDLTWSDFNDENLLKEFVDKKIMLKNEIDSIVKRNEAFETK